MHILKRLYSNKSHVGRHNEQGNVLIQVKALTSVNQ